MKVLLVTYEYPPDRGGVAKYLGGLFGPLPSTRVLKLRPPKFPLAWLLQLPKILMASRAADCLVISHLLPLGTAALLSGKPYAVIVHGLDLRLARRKRALASQVLRRAKRVIANSLATASELVWFGLSPDSALVLTPGIDEAWIAKAETVRLVPAEKRKTILAVGRFVPRKGFDRLIRMLADLRARCGEVMLVLAGAGPEEGKLRKEAGTAGVGPYVRFVIAPDQAQLASEYAACTVFALPARASEDDLEGFGIVLLEAALFGKPVVGSRVGGISEAVQDGVTGLLADPDSDQALLEKLARLLNDPETAAQLGIAGHARVLRSFRWKDRVEILQKQLA